MSINATAKSKIYIGAAFNAEPQLADYTGQTWTEIGEVNNLGTWGAKGKELTSVVLGDAYTRRLKGSIDSGTVQLVVNRDPFDAGQIAALTASKDWNTYLFKVELNDKVTSDGTNSLFYFRASVMSAEHKLDTADTITETTFTLGITGQILEVSATVNIVFAPIAGALLSATHSTAYTETVSATGGLGTVTYAIASGSLPAGLTLNPATGAITGTPTASGSFAFAISATFSGVGEATANYTLNVA